MESPTSTLVNQENTFFGGRCRLFRYSKTDREWQKRGVGEIQILHHPDRNTYRLLFRLEQVHKAVLNMLFTELELQPMSNSDRAWTWAGRNYADNAAGDLETLAVRFKTLETATEFFEKVKECVRENTSFGGRCNLFRYSKTDREWQERGIGEIQILHHPDRNTYRLLFRLEQVHKAVLNMLFTELELQPMSNSDRAWTWAGRNYADNAAGDLETLAVRFKTLETATEFLEKVKECVRENTLFGGRCNLFRYSKTDREWQERGIGEIQILHHPDRNTYRLLFRLEQVHKAVLNMLFTELELQPMSNSDRAWTWAGRNYADNAAGDLETLAVRFKTLETATEFFEKVKECVRENTLFGGRCNLFRYSKTDREWQERGIGEIQILHHPDRNTYRLLFRLEQVHKAVLNMLFTELELQPMSNSDRAWTWAGRNYADNAAGDLETLAVRFKTLETATEFLEKVKECVRENTLFGGRCNLFRYSKTDREWQERGIGEIQILHHPDRNTYRLLFRLEQVHKAVLNMLFTELELQPMSNSDRAWTWAGRNYADNAAGDLETLAVRFKTLETATEFFEKVKECVRKCKQHKNSAADADTSKE